MTEPRWLSKPIVLALHDETLALFGGSDGVRDEGLLDRALAAPRHLHAYEDPDLSALAACYAARILRNHPFVDGDKRTALLSAVVFLRLNGRLLEPEETDEVRTVLALAAGEIAERNFAAWIRKNTRSAG